MAPPNLTKADLTAEMTNLENARQDEVDAGNGVEDALDSGGQPRQQPTDGDDADQGRQARTVIARSPQDDARAAIANRFKRGAQDIPFDGDLTNPENLYGAAGRAPALEPDPDGSVVGEALNDDDYDAQAAARETQPQPKPKTRVLKVRGQDVTMTDDEILAAAQKTLAADSYLEDARKLLESSKEIIAERGGRGPQHPEGRTTTQDDGDDVDPETGQPRHPEDEFETLAEQLQYGDPKQNAKLLKGAIQKEAGKAAGEDHINRLFNNDLAKSQKALKDFEAANPDLANDDLARSAIEKIMYGLYREDIVKLGLDESQIPSTPRELANWHRFYKVNGHEVRNTSEMLETAKTKLNAWRGVSTTTKAAPRKEAPRVEVNVDRTRRREGIPNQPNRAVVPRRDVQQAPAKTPGSDVVAQMRKARGQV